MVRIARYFAIICIACFQLIGAEHILLVMLRIFIIVVFYIELNRFRKVLISCIGHSELPVKIKHTISMIPLTGYGFLFAGLIMELGGNVQLAILLAVSLLQTLGCSGSGISKFPSRSGICTSGPWTGR